MGSYAASLDGTTIIASDDLQQATLRSVLSARRHRACVVVAKLAEKTTVEVRSDGWILSDQALLHMSKSSPLPLKRIVTNLHTQRSFTVVNNAVGLAYRSARNTLVFSSASAVELYTTGKEHALWSQKYALQVNGLAISRGGKFVAIALGTRDTTKRILVVHADTGAELWRKNVTDPRVTFRGLDPLFFSNDGRHLVHRANTKVQIRNVSNGATAWQVDVGRFVMSGFDETVHAGFDGKYLWFYSYHPIREPSHMLPSRGSSPTDFCDYAVFNVSKNRQVAEAIGATDVDKLLLGKHVGGSLCNVRGVLPLDDGGVLVVEYVNAQLLRVHRLATVPGA